MDAPLSHHRVRGERYFRWRNHEISRIEGLSDAVFAFAITLLVISLEVPETFAELSEKMHGFVAFGISFALLFQVWKAQYRFFRRYSLQDGTTVFLNGALLFVVLCYTYPLKFLFTFLTSLLTGGGGMAHLKDGSVVRMVEPNQFVTLMVVYGVGLTAVSAVLALLYGHAYRLRDELGLDELERVATRESVTRNVVFCVVALLSIGIALAGGPRWAPAAGMAYLLLAPVLSIHGWRTGRRIRALAQSREVATPA